MSCDVETDNDSDEPANSNGSVFCEHSDVRKNSSSNIMSSTNKTKATSNIKNTDHRSIKNSSDSNNKNNETSNYLNTICKINKLKKEINQIHNTHFPPSKNRIVSVRLFIETLPSLIISILSQYLCGIILDSLLMDSSISKEFPVVVVVDSILIFMGNLETAFDMNVLVSFNITDHHESSNINIRGINNMNRLLKTRSHILKASSFLIIDSLFVSVIITCISMFYKLIFNDYSINMMDLFKYILRLLCIILPTCFVSMPVTISGILLCLYICRRWNCDADNLAIPVVSSFNEVASVFVVKLLFLFIAYQQISNTVLLVLLLLLIILVLVASFLLNSLSKKYEQAISECESNNKNMDINTSSPHFVTYFCTFIAITISTCLLEKASESYQQIASLSLIYCGLVVNIITIYNSRVSTYIVKLNMQYQAFCHQVRQILFDKKIKVEILRKWSFKDLIRKSIKKERSTIVTLTFSTFLLSLIYVFSVDLPSLLKYCLVLLFSVSSLGGMGSVKFFLRFEHWLEPDVLSSNENDKSNNKDGINRRNRIKQSLLNGRLGSTSLIFTTMFLDVIGVVLLWLCLWCAA